MHAALLALSLVLTTAPPRTPVLVELFTSQACDNCPPQEEVLARLVQAQPLEGVELIPLAFHVSSWDHLGWKDRFGSPDFSRRQRRYAASRDHNRLHMPHMVVDGERSFLADEEKARVHAAASARRSKVPLRLTMRTEKEAVVLRVHLETKPERDVELWAALAEDGLTTRVTRGPNAGRTLTHPAVVRTWAVFPQVQPEAEGFSTELRLKLPSSWKRERLRAVVALQAPWGGRVEGVAAAALGARR